MTAIPTASPTPEASPQATDKERFVALMTHFGIVLVDMPDGSTDIQARAGDKQEGYAGFVAAWHFDNAGAFVKMGIWE